MYGKGSKPKIRYLAAGFANHWYTIQSIQSMGQDLLLWMKGRSTVITTVPTIFGVNNNLQLDELTHTHDGM